VETNREVLERDVGWDCNSPYRGVVERLGMPDFHSESSDIPAWSPALTCCSTACPC